MPKFILPVSKEHAMYMEFTYAAYVAFSLAVTVWIASTLRRSGRSFLVQRYASRPEMADSLSHLLAVGFYLVHLGFAMLALRFGGDADNLPTAIEVWSTKVGWVLCLLALSTYMHLKVFLALRGGAAVEPPPVPRPAEVVSEATG
jgi:hypothetical protein